MYVDYGEFFYSGYEKYIKEFLGYVVEQKGERDPYEKLALALDLIIGNREHEFPSSFNNKPLKRNYMGYKSVRVGTNKNHWRLIHRKGTDNNIVILALLTHGEFDNVQNPRDDLNDVFY